jgi:LysM repeat protein
MLDYLKRFLIAGIMALCVSLLFFGGKSQAQGFIQEENWIWPTDGIISDTFGTRLGAHKGIDIAASLNTPVFAVDDGIVTKSYYSDTYGNVIFIKHNNNFETVYAHLNKRHIHEGQAVHKGDTIGLMGNTGKSYGVHLHFEVHENEWTYEKENAVNPSHVLGEIEIGSVVQAFNEDHAQYVVRNINTDDMAEASISSFEKNTYNHIVHSGESLWVLAEQYETTVENLQKANGLTTTTIFENQPIKVPNSFVYIVQEGDTLSDISLKTNVSIEGIKKMNQLQNDRIFPNQTLNILVNKR